MADWNQRLIILGGVEHLRRFVAWELDHDDSTPRPFPLQGARLATAYDELAAMLGDHPRRPGGVGGIGVRIVHINFADEIRLGHV